MRFVSPFIYMILLMMGLLDFGNELIVYAAIATAIFHLIYGIGKKAVILEMVSLFYILTCLVMPVIGYAVFNYQHYLSRIFRKYMYVDEGIYYDYAFPSVLGFVIILSWPTAADSQENWEILLSRAKAILKKFTSRGYEIVYVGIISAFISSIIPQSFRFFSELFFFASFAGILYIYYSETGRYKWVTIIVFILILFVISINSTMFTVITYMGATIFSFFLLGNRSSIGSKLAIFISAVFLLLILQNTKTIFRKSLRKQKVESKTELFLKIAADESGKVGSFVNSNDFFPFYIRVNQGWYVSTVMRLFPEVKPFDKGERLGQVLASAFVPRFIWSDKPEAGGKFNMLYYSNLVIYGFSTNVGPLGEAYGSFGRDGGVLLVLLLAIFIKIAYQYVLKLAITYPLLIFWIPVLFYQTVYSSENDFLQVLNSLTKTSLFIWIIYKIYPAWLGVIKPKNNNVTSIPLSEI